MNKKKLNSSKININPRSSAKLLPKSSGVYIFSNPEGNVIYVGKAKNLRSRALSYFSSKEPRAKRIKKEIDHIDFIVADSEEHSLMLENDLIKKYKPKLNIRLKDDKSFPYIKIDINESYPQVYITRNIQKDGAKYFGPYASASNVRKTLNLLNKLFPYRSCTKKITGNDPKPCLEFHINRCIAPCSGESTKEEYSDVIKQTISFLEGNTKATLKKLNKSMWNASDSEEYEQAGAFRDNINALESLFEKQGVVTSKITKINSDAIGIASNNYETWIDILIIREGKVKGRDHFQMEVQDFHTKSSIISSFIQKYYLNNSNHPSEILSSTPIDEVENLEHFLKNRAGKKIKIINPLRGPRKEVVNFLNKNIDKWVEYRESKIYASKEISKLALDNIQEQLNLAQVPRIIECYDISHIQGTSIVGSMVVFENGEPNKSKYRRFEIKTSNKNDDYAALREVFTRRCKRIKDSDEAQQPNLMLVDGGKGQLSSTHEVLLRSGLKNIEIASIAKKREEIYMPNNFEPILLEIGSTGRHLIQRIRDEAHRFAITYHRSKRSKKMLNSEIDNIIGIGAVKKKTLINHFGSIKNIRDAIEEEIATLTGISKNDAKNIKNVLN